MVEMVHFMYVYFATIKKNTRVWHEKPLELCWILTLNSLSREMVSLMKWLAADSLQRLIFGLYLKKTENQSHPLRSPGREEGRVGNGISWLRQRDAWPQKPPHLGALSFIHLLTVKTTANCLKCGFASRKFNHMVWGSIFWWGILVKELNFKQNFGNKQNLGSGPYSMKTWECHWAATSDLGGDLAVCFWKKFQETVEMRSQEFSSL